MPQKAMNPSERSAEALEALYRHHPVREGPLLDRLRARGRGLADLTAHDLAEDLRTRITDQNHVGGSRAVYALAAAIGLRPADRVLDLGCGLGGPARLLAHRFGCRVDGLDVSRQRIREGRRLTALVGLTGLVTLRRANMLRARVPPRRYDVLWGQSAWSHVADLPRFLRRWRRALKTGGRIAVEDVYLKRAPRTAAERRLLVRLESDWHSTLIARADWRRALTAAETEIVLDRDLSRGLMADFVALERAAGHRSDVPPLERRAWRNAIRAAETGLIGYVRLAAVAQTADDAVRS